MLCIDGCLALSVQLGTLAVMVDPIDEKAILFYQKYCFLSLKERKDVPPDGNDQTALQALKPKNIS